MKIKNILATYICVSRRQRLPPAPQHIPVLLPFPALATISETLKMDFASFSGLHSLNTPSLSSPVNELPADSALGG